MPNFAGLDNSLWVSIPSFFKRLLNKKSAKRVEREKYYNNDWLFYHSQLGSEEYDGHSDLTMKLKNSDKKTMYRADIERINLLNDHNDKEEKYYPDVSYRQPCDEENYDLFFINFSANTANKDIDEKIKACLNNLNSNEKSYHDGSIFVCTKSDKICNLYKFSVSKGQWKPIKYRRESSNNNSNHSTFPSLKESVELLKAAINQNQNDGEMMKLNAEKESSGPVRQFLQLYRGYTYHHPSERAEPKLHIPRAEDCINNPRAFFRSIRAFGAQINALMQNPDLVERHGYKRIVEKFFLSSLKASARDTKTKRIASIAMQCLIKTILLYMVDIRLLEVFQTHLMQEISNDKSSLSCLKPSEKDINSLLNARGSYLYRIIIERCMNAQIFKKNLADFIKNKPKHLYTLTCQLDIKNYIDGELDKMVSIKLIDAFEAKIIAALPEEQSFKNFRQGIKHLVAARKAVLDSGNVTNQNRAANPFSIQTVDHIKKLILNCREDMDVEHYVEDNKSRFVALLLYHSYDQCKADKTKLLAIINAIGLDEEEKTSFNGQIFNGGGKLVSRNEIAQYIDDWFDSNPDYMDLSDVSREEKAWMTQEGVHEFCSNLEKTCHKIDQKLNDNQCKYPEAKTLLSRYSMACRNFQCYWSENTDYRQYKNSTCVDQKRGLPQASSAVFVASPQRLFSQNHDKTSSVNLDDKQDDDESSDASYKSDLPPLRKRSIGIIGSRNESM